MPVTLMQAHGMMMILGFIFFGSTGILFARYGRTIRFGLRRQLLGKAVWFQIHRFLLSITSMLILLGFFFILVRAGGKWVDPQISLIRFVHSIFGVIIICCVILQIWLALYRCNPRSRYRYIFDWSHRIVGLAAFILFHPTVFLIIVTFSKTRTPLVIIFAIWTGWIILAITIFEKIDYQQRRTVLPSNGGNDGSNQNNNNSEAAAPDTESGTNMILLTRHATVIKLIMFLLHFIISITLCISFIVVFCS